MEITFIIKIAALIALIAFVVLAVFLIISINSFIKLTREAKTSLEVLTKDVSGSLNRITHDVNELKDKFVQSLYVLDNTTQQIVTTTQRIEKDFNGVVDMFAPFRELTDMVYSRIAPPITKFTILFSAVSKAATAFIDLLSRKL